MSQEPKPALPFNPPTLIPLVPRLSKPREADQPAKPESSSQTNTLFATTSLELAAYLILQGRRVVKVTGPRPRRTVWFDRVAESMKLDFYNGAQAPACRLFEVWHSLKHGLVNLR